MRLTDPSPDDGQKLVGNQAGAACKRAVHAVSTKQRGGVVRLDTAAVLYGKRLSRFLPEHLTETAPNDGVRLLSLLRGSVVFEIADCLDRFVRDAQTG